MYKKSEAISSLKYDLLVCMSKNNISILNIKTSGNMNAANRNGNVELLKIPPIAKIVMFQRL